jgi:hypothetical protein
MSVFNHAERNDGKATPDMTIPIQSALYGVILVEQLRRRVPCYSRAPNQMATVLARPRVTEPASRKGIRPGGLILQETGTVKVWDYSSRGPGREQSLPKDSSQSRGTALQRYQHPRRTLCNSGMASVR